MENAYSTTARYTFSSNFRFSPVTEEYRSGNSRDGSIEDDDAYMGDEYESKDGYEDSSSNSDFQPKVRYTFTFHIFLSSKEEKRYRFRIAFLFISRKIKRPMIYRCCTIYFIYIVRLSCFYVIFPRTIESWDFFIILTIRVKYNDKRLFCRTICRTFATISSLYKRLYRKRKSRGNFFQIDLFKRTNDIIRDKIKNFKKRSMRLKHTVYNTRLKFHETTTFFSTKRHLSEL